MSFFISLSGLRNASTDLEVISNNIANAESVGFKKSNAQFADLVSGSSATDPRKTPGIGATVSAISQDFALGQLEQTGRALDVAINGDGFIATNDAISGEVSFTRNGNLQLVANGELQDAFGNPVQGFPLDATGTPTSFTPSDIIVPTTNAGGAALSSVGIDLRGVLSAVYTDGSVEPISQIALATFPSTGGLNPIGLTKWEATAESGPPEFGQPGVGNFGQLRSGSLERSNVDLAEEMVALLGAQRNFQANARAIDTATAFTQTILNLQR